MTMLFEPIFEGGLRSIKFFNGRLLSGEDLTSEQSAHRAALRRLGQRLGEGVSQGLKVSVQNRGGGGTVPKLGIDAGTAIDRAGNLISLPRAIEIELRQPAADSATTSAASSGGLPTFRVCLPPQTGPYVHGTAVYLLTIAAAEGAEGRAPVLGVGGEDDACNARYLVEGVVFKAHQVEVPAEELVPSERARLRGRLALRAFDVARASSFAENPFIQDTPTTLSGLRVTPALGDDEVPLALVFWVADTGVEFIDHWSVRRGPAGPDLVADPAVSALGPLVPRSLAAREAMFLQFQEHVADVVATPGAAPSVVARKRFQYLPPAGLLPLARWPFNDGFIQATFFDGLLTWRPSDAEPLYLEGARLGALLRTALDYPPITMGQEAIWVYRVRENQQAVEASTTSPARPYLVFAHGQMPNFAEARADAARWGMANFV